MKKILIALATVSTILLSGCDGDFLESNRCALLDRNHTFTHAKVLVGDKVEEHEVVAWMDYKESDVVQLWVKDDSCPKKMKVILTHYSRVILENPDPKYQPKF